MLHWLSLKCILVIGIWIALFNFIGCKPEKMSPPDPIPERPNSYVFDELHILSPKMLRLLESLLIEHDHLTGEQCLIGIFKTLGNQSLEDRTHQIFLKWKIKKRDTGKGLLLAIYLEQKKTKLEAGLGLSSILTDSVSNAITSKIQVKKSNSLFYLGSLRECIFEILELLNSPVIQSGKTPIFLQEEDFPSAQIEWPPLFLFFGAVLLLLTLFHLLSREAHFTKDSWFRPSLWKSIKNRCILKNHDSNHRANDRGGTVGQW